MQPRTATVRGCRGSEIIHVIRIETVGSAHRRAGRDGDLKDQTLFNLNFQPVIPFRVTARWNAIARTIVPINSMPAGPTTRFSGVVLSDNGPWVVGGLIQQYWPVVDDEGDTDPKTDLFVAQPFVNYNFGPGWALGFAPLITANWDADSGQQWTVPLGLGITRVTVLGARPMNVGIQYYYNVKRPDGAPAYQLRFIVALLFPRK